MERGHGVTDVLDDEGNAVASELVAWLASDASAHCTGSEFVIDGGYLAGPLTAPGTDA
jgi:hypothetical protein